MDHLNCCRAVASNYLCSLLIISLGLINFCEAAFAAEQDRVTLRVRFGMRDQEPTDWSGKLVVPPGEVESIRGVRWMQRDSAEGNTWNVHTRRRNPQGTADRKRIEAGLSLPMMDNGILVTLRGCNENDPLRLQAGPADITFRLNQIPYGKSLWTGNGNVVIQRVPPVQPLATTMADEDYPAVATSKDGTVYAVYLAFTRGRDFQGARENLATKESPPTAGTASNTRMIEQPGDLAYLAQPAGGEQLYLRILRDGTWSDPISVQTRRPSLSIK